MPKQIVPAASLRSITRLPVARVLVWASNYLILMASWSIGRAIFQIESNFLPALREGRTARQPSTSRNLGCRGTFAGKRRESRSQRGDAIDREGRGVLSRGNRRNAGHSRAPPARDAGAWGVSRCLRDGQSLAGGYAWRETP